MSYVLLLADADGKVTTSFIAIRELREFSGGEGLSVHFRPVRNDQLFESAKAAGRLAYRILFGEGVVRAQLWIEYEVLGPHVNVTGRSSDLLFALALITSKWKRAAGRYPAIAATGVLDADGAALIADGITAVQGVRHTVAKVAAAVHALSQESDAVIFFPAADAQTVAEWRHGAPERSTQKMPFNTRRSSTRGTPLGLFGSKGSITRHSKSVRSYRLMPILHQKICAVGIQLMGSRPN